MRLPLLVAGFCPSVAFAQTVNYTYDSRGHLIEAKHQGGRNATVTVTQVYDPTDNRTQLTVTGQSVDTVIVVPLNGFTVIPIN